MFQVIGFFRSTLENITGLINFVMLPLGELNSDINFEPFASMSIMQLLGSSLVATLGVLLVIHLVRLFIGG